MRAERASEQYAVRRFEPSDREEFLALDEVVWDRQQDAEWFAWKYESNPYVDHVPIFVAERDGDLVGARPLMAFRIRVGDAVVTAMQPSDTMVHPDHRRQGLFTRMTRQTLEFHAERDTAFFFNFPNEVASGGYRKLGWVGVGRRVTYHRVQDPTPFLSDAVGGRPGQLLGGLAASLVRRYYDARSRFVSQPSGVTVERRPGVAADLLATLADRQVPSGFHAVRDEEFYRWRFGSPAWDRRTYVAAVDGDPVVGVVARKRTNSDGIALAQVADVAPLGGDSRWREALGAALVEIVDDHADRHLLSAPGSVVPSDLLAALGFYSDTRPPLSRFTRDTVIVVRPSGEPTSTPTVNGHELDRRANWQPTYAERDTV